MPWKETGVMEQKLGFVIEAIQERESTAQLCRKYGISRTTGYKWVERFLRNGREGLEDRSRRPFRHPREIAESVREEILAAKGRHSKWGPGKLRDLLVNEQPARYWPCRSSFARVLKAAGLTVSRRRRRKTPSYSEPFGGTYAPNDTWCTDFKGWFYTGRGEKCHPLTISDAYSRYLIRCVGLSTCDGESVKRVFRAAFMECGLPRAIRSDNGPPFASKGIKGLSRLSVWWIKLGIVPERIEPGKPQQNGRHERMHRTLKQEATKPAEATMSSQQRRFDRFREEYNTVRPHEALGGTTPERRYERSVREYPEVEPEVEYGEGVAVRRVRSNGQVKWSGGMLFIGEALVDELVGFERLDDRHWSVQFGSYELGWYDQRAGALVIPPEDGNYF